MARKMSLSYITHIQTHIHVCMYVCMYVMNISLSLAKGICLPKVILEHHSITNRLLSLVGFCPFCHLAICCCCCCTNLPRPADDLAINLTKYY